MKIPIPVHRDLGASILSEHVVIVTAGVSFVFGAVVTLFAVSAATPAPTVPMGSLASVGAFEYTAHSPLDLSRTEPVGEVPVGEVSGAAVETISTEPSSPTAQTQRERQTVEELHLLIADREIALFRIADELERIKRESINTTAAFTQNCNNWGDYCAGPYKERLDALNSEYARLSTLLSELSTELEALRATRSEP